MADRLSEAAQAAWKAFRQLSDAGVPNEFIAGMSVTLDRGLREARKRSHLTVIRGQADEWPLLTRPFGTIDPNCTCSECVRARSEGRKINAIQHFGRVGRVVREDQHLLVDLNALSKPRQIYSCVPSQPTDASKTRPSDRYIGDDSADDAPKAG